MNSRVSMLIAVLISMEACAQINPKFKYSTGNGYSEDDSGSIHFPESIESPEDDKELAEAKKTQGSAVPLDLIEKINKVGNVSEFFDEFIAKDGMDSAEMIASRFGDGSVERSVGVLAKPANCIPQTTVVPLEPINMSKDPTIVYFPSCTRVNRCGGCCSSPLLSCQPVEIETITFLIYKSQYTGGTKMAFRGKEAVLVDQHTKCKCDCRIKKSDCNAYQIYDPSQCKCICTNYDEQEKCLSQAEKIWDADNCRCRCRHTKECTTGTYFDEHQCRCFEVSDGTYSGERTPLLDRKRFILKAIPVIPDNNTKYDHEP